MSSRTGSARHPSAASADHAAPTPELGGLIVTDAAKAFGPRVLWQELTFQVPSGQIMALTGPSGSGKSTLLNCVGLLDDLDSGAITLNGEVMSGASPRRQRIFRRDQLGYLFQNYALIDNATVYENLDVATGRLSIRRRRKLADHDNALARVGLEGRGGDLVFRLSGGEQQRVAVARLLLRRPRLVLADEPTGALDQANADVVLDFLRAMADDGCTIVVATHSRDVAERCDLHLQLGEPAQEVFSPASAFH